MGLVLVVSSLSCDVYVSIMSSSLALLAWCFIWSIDFGVRIYAAPFVCNVFLCSICERYSFCTSRRE